MGAVNGVFIIESLDIEDENANRFEGVILKKMLEMIGVKVKYFYIRTKDELKFFINEFEDSDYRYLHLSCHGNNEGIATSLNEETILFSELSGMFEFYGEGKRIFLSSCSVMNGDNILNDMGEDEFLSFTGPTSEINFQEGAIFWSSFYHLMFAKNKKSMKNKDIKETIKKLADTFNLEINTFIKKKNNNNYTRYWVTSASTSCGGLNLYNVLDY